MNWFYDFTESKNVVADVEIMYCFNFDDFEEQDWQLLIEIYQRLPGLYRLSEVPCWYGTPNEAHYLYASVEPPGLQVAGKLPIADWHSWQTAFQALVQLTALPRYEAEA